MGLYCYVFSFRSVISRLLVRSFCLMIRSNRCASNLCENEIFRFIKKILWLLFWIFLKFLSYTSVFVVDFFFSWDKSKFSYWTRTVFLWKLQLKFPFNPKYIGHFSLILFRLHLINIGYWDVIFFLRFLPGEGGTWIKDSDSISVIGKVGFEAEDLGC